MVKSKEVIDFNTKDVVFLRIIFNNQKEKYYIMENFAVHFVQYPKEEYYNLLMEEYEIYCKEKLDFELKLRKSKELFEKNKPYLIKAGFLKK